MEPGLVTFNGISHICLCKEGKKNDGADSLGFEGRKYHLHKGSKLKANKVYSIETSLDDLIRCYNENNASAINTSNQRRIVEIKSAVLKCDIVDELFVYHLICFESKSKKTTECLLVSVFDNASIDVEAYFQLASPYRKGFDRMWLMDGPLLYLHSENELLVLTCSNGSQSETVAQLDVLDIVRHKTSTLVFTRQNDLYQLIDGGKSLELLHHFNFSGYTITSCAISESSLCLGTCNNQIIQYNLSTYNVESLCPVSGLPSTSVYGSMHGNKVMLVKSDDSQILAVYNCNNPKNLKLLETFASVKSFYIDCFLDTTSNQLLVIDAAGITRLSDSSNVYVLGSKNREAVDQSGNTSKSAGILADILKSLQTRLSVANNQLETINSRIKEKQILLSALKQNVRRQNGDMNEWKDGLVELAATTWHPIEAPQETLSKNQNSEEELKILSVEAKLNPDTKQLHIKLHIQNVATNDDISMINLMLFSNIGFLESNCEILQELKHGESGVIHSFANLDFENSFVLNPILGEDDQQYVYLSLEYSLGEGKKCKVNLSKMITIEALEVSLIHDNILDIQHQSTADNRVVAMESKMQPVHPHRFSFQLTSKYSSFRILCDKIIKANSNLAVELSSNQSAMCHITGRDVLEINNTLNVLLNYIADDVKLSPMLSISSSELIQLVESILKHLMDEITHLKFISLSQFENESEQTVTTWWHTWIKLQHQTDNQMSQLASYMSSINM